MILKDNNPVLADFPNPRSNVFLMMRFRKTKQHKEISDAILSVLAKYSLNLIRADSKQYQDELWANVESCIDASFYGIAVFEQIDERDINPNVSLELGYMLGQRKKCLLLKEKRVPTLQTDLVGHLYHEFDSYNIEETVKTEIQDWLRSLGIAKRSDERMIAYVSLGGTCRCAIAKAITQKLIQRFHLNYKLRVESVAHGMPSLPGASNGARQAIQRLFDEDLLANHRTIKLTDTILEDADLILVMDHSLLKGLIGPKTCDKTHVFKPFFGLEGDIVDPWPDSGDEVASRRYLQCATEIKETLEPNIEKIISTLNLH